MNEELIPIQEWAVKNKVGKRKAYRLAKGLKIPSKTVLAEITKIETREVLMLPKDALPPLKEK